MVEYLIVIAIFICVVTCMCWLINDRIRYFNCRTYVYPKSGHRYYIRDYLKSKNPTTGEWYAAVRYFGLDDSKYYVREHKDFFDKFVPLKEWENGRGQS